MENNDEDDSNQRNFKAKTENRPKEELKIKQQMKQRVMNMHISKTVLPVEYNFAFAEYLIRLLFYGLVSSWLLVKYAPKSIVVYLLATWIFAIVLRFILIMVQRKNFIRISQEGIVINGIKNRTYRWQDIVKVLELAQSDKLMIVTKDSYYQIKLEHYKERYNLYKTICGLCAEKYEYILEHEERKVLTDIKASIKTKNLSLKQKNQKILGNRNSFDCYQYHNN